MARPIIVGWLDLPHAITLRTQYEVAAWHTDARVEPGRYLIEESTSYERVIWTIRFPGTIVSEYTAALWGGVPIESNVPQGAAHRNVGRGHESSVWFDRFARPSLARQVAETGVYRLHGVHSGDYVDCPVRLFGMVARETSKSWAVEYSPAIVGKVQGRMVWTTRPRGHWYHWHEFRPVLALAAGGAR